MTEAYLYSFWHGQLKIYEGKVLPRTRRLYTSFIVEPFLSNEEHEELRLWHEIIQPDSRNYDLDRRQRQKRFTCAFKEGVVYNMSVWFREKDDEKARNLLIKHKEQRISVLQADLDRAKRGLKEIQNGVWTHVYTL